MVKDSSNETPSPETAVSAYKDNGEYLNDQLEWLDLSIALRLHIQESLESELRMAAPDGEVLSGVQLFEGMIEAGSNPRFDKYAIQYSERLDEVEKFIEARLRLSREKGIFLAIPYLSEIFGLTSLEVKAIIVCLAVESDRKYESAYELLQQETGSSGKHPTVDLIAQLVSLSAEQRLQARALFNETGALKKYFLQKVDGLSKLSSLLSQPVKLEERIVQFIMESSRISSSMEHYATLIPPIEPSTPLLGNTDIQHRLRQWISNRLIQPDQVDASLLISIWGKLGSGKKTQLSHLCHYFREPILLIDMAKMLIEDSNVFTLMKKVFREATIQQAILVLSNYHRVMGASARESAGQGELILDELSEMTGIVFLLSEEPLQPFDRKRRIDLELELPPLEDEERAVAWQQLAQDYEVDHSIDWESLSSRFLFNPGQMVNALRSARNLSEWNHAGSEANSLGWRDMIQASYKQLNHTLGSKAKRLSPKNSWNDLILPVIQMEKLQHACNHIQYKHTVYGRWGFNKKLSYGTGISLLFSGPPGTGKTMASEIVAKELDMEIYKIDLSQIISKYIGETEKNLKEIFDEAQASYAVLFFDEADALFGKRSEVKDSHDKNANTEVAFLLQKMEEYRGISILATNYLQNMDEAFLRRINYVIRFPFPDDKQRETIWQHVFPKQTPLESDIDFGFLARKLQMAGGSIKNIALTSAFLASGKNEKVGMQHIFKAYQYELDKTNRAITRDEIGEYAYLFDELSSSTTGLK